MKSLEELARSLHCFEQVDTNCFQRRARVLQGLWRQQQNYPMGEHRGKLRGSRLAMPWAKQTLANFLSEPTRQLVRQTLSGKHRQSGRLIQPLRMYTNLLSSQPLAFNLFAPLQQDLHLASQVFAELLPGRCQQVTKIDFEFSPGRGEVRYTGDRSAFDVCVWFRTPQGGRGFVGIEVKYHENLCGPADDHRQRYEQVAATLPTATWPLRRSTKRWPGYVR